jgi:hypothetical protein
MFAIKLGVDDRLMTWRRVKVSLVSPSSRITYKWFSAEIYIHGELCNKILLKVIITEKIAPEIHPRLRGLEVSFLPVELLVLRSNRAWVIDGNFFGVVGVVVMVSDPLCLSSSVLHFF